MVTEEDSWFEEVVAIAQTDEYAKRIARVPEMEAELVRLEDKVEALLGHLEMAVDWLRDPEDRAAGDLADMLSKAALSKAVVRYANQV